MLVYVVILLKGIVNFCPGFSNHFLQPSLTGNLAAGARHALAGIRLDLYEFHHFAVLSDLGSDILHLAPERIEVFVKHIDVIFVCDSCHRFRRCNRVFISRRTDVACLHLDAVAERLYGRVRVDCAALLVLNKHLGAITCYGSREVVIFGFQELQIRQRILIYLFQRYLDGFSAAAP